MLHFAVNEKTLEGKTLVAFLKTQTYISLIDEPNVATIKAIKEVETGKVKKAKNPEDLIRQILG